MTEPHRYQYADVVDRVGVDLYTVSMVADAVGKSAATVRRWLRYVESPKPSHHAVNGLVEMRLWDDDDLNELGNGLASCSPVLTRSIRGLSGVYPTSRMTPRKSKVGSLSRT